MTEKPAGPAGPRVSPGSLRELGPINAIISKIGARAIGADDMHLFSTLGRARRLFPAWLAYSAMLMPFGALPRKDSETVIVRVAHLRGNTYESGHHRRIGKRAGITDSQFDSIYAGEGWDERSTALLAAATELVNTKAIGDATWAKVTTAFSERQQVELVLLITQYDGLATAIDTLGITPEK